MSEHYHDVGDLRFLKEMGKLAPPEFNAWLALDNIVRREGGAIPRKYRELIALEITESSMIAAALRAGGAATHGAMALKFYDQG
jgi:hypothetical protein